MHPFTPPPPPPLLKTENRKGVEKGFIENEWVKVHESFIFLINKIYLLEKGMGMVLRITPAWGSSIFDVHTERSKKIDQICGWTRMLNRGGG